jgi:hypothetical protein
LVARVLGIALVLVMIVGLLGSLATIGSVVAADEAVTFPDPNLEAAIREAIAKPTGLILRSDLQGLTYFSSGANRHIINLAGLEYCTSLEYLYLYLNQISDISPLANLSNLVYLHLGWNQISDISALGNLTTLYGLHLEGNQIDDVSPLVSLTSLTVLDLDGNIWIDDVSPLANLTSLSSLSLNTNRIGDVSSLANLTNLTALHLAQNRISNVSPLGNLTNLTEVWLQFNQISDTSALANLTDLIQVDLRYNQIGDVSPLVQNEGLGTGDEVDLRENPLSCDSICIYIPQLEARGVDVSYDAQGCEGCEGCVGTATGTGVACLTPSAGVIEDLEALPAIPPGAPAGIMFPHGMFSFRITGLELGEEVTVTIELPGPVHTGTRWWKQYMGAWYSVPVTIVAPNIIAITLTDGVFPGDSDKTKDTVITDPGGPGYPGTVGWETYPIDKVRVLLPWTALAAAIIVGMSLLVLRRRHS